MIRKALGFMAFGVAPTLAIVLIACSSDTPTDKYPSADSFCGARATEECKGTATLCSITDTTCQAKRKDVCNGVAAGATGSGRTYHPSLADACITKVTAAYADKII